MRSYIVAVTIMAAAFSASGAAAAVCDHRPTAVLGKAATLVVTNVASVAGGSSVVARYLKLYGFRHAKSASPMLGSGVGGASAAGTVGIIGGLKGAGAAVLGLLAKPVVLPVSVAFVGGVIVYEGGCELLGS